MPVKKLPKLKRRKTAKSPRKKKLDLSLLERFTKRDDDQEFKMTKIASKREGSMVGVGQYETGDFSLMELSLKDAPDAVGGFITGRGFNYLRTSPILKIVDHDDISTTFETEGGIYKVQMWPKPRTATKPKECPDCKTVSDLKDMEMKMGGLLCPKCRVILYQPYVDEEYFDERVRRVREKDAEARAAEAAEENRGGDGQEGS